MSYLAKKSVQNEIPIFFSTDDNYIPYLDVAISSLIENAAKEHAYRIIILNTGLSQENVNKIMKNEREGFTIEFADITNELEKVKDKLKDVYHFSLVTYYRLFIASIFPQYDKIIYLDCDLVVLGDISRLYYSDIGDNILGAVPDQFVKSTDEFRAYARKAIGVDPDTYVNAGVLLINLAQFRKYKVEEEFVRIISSYDFDLLDPDQAYLNYLCRDKIYLLESCWNTEPMPVESESEKNIVHYALYKKPWQYDDVIYGEFFWHYAKTSPFYETICRNRDGFSEEEKAKKEDMAGEILSHAFEIIDSGYTFALRLN